jgi:hypothetical protein
VLLKQNAYARKKANTIFPLVCVVPFTQFCSSSPCILWGEKMHFEHLTDTTVRMQSNNEEEEVKRIIIIAQ